MSVMSILSRRLLALPARRAAAVAVVDLKANHAWSAVAPRGGLTVRCEKGSVWVTVEGDPEDHIVVAPGTFSTGRGRVAALALEAARIAIQRGRPAEEPAPAATWAGAPEA